jgi:hypothetical protein
MTDESIKTQQLIYLAQDATENIRLAKRTQWNVGYYTLLLNVGIVVVAERVAEILPPEIGNRVPWAVLGGILAFITWAGGLTVIWRMQGWIKKHRAFLNKMEEQFCEEYQKLVSNQSENYINIMYASEIPWLLTVILSLAFVVSIGLVIMVFGKN